jgi:hypothetical protein
MSDPLAKIREQLKAGKGKPAAKSAVKPTSTTAPNYPINPHQLDALYARGTQSVVGSNSHYAGLRAVYDAGVKGLRE